MGNSLWNVSHQCWQHLICCGGAGRGKSSPVIMVGSKSIQSHQIHLSAPLGGNLVVNQREVFFWDGITEPPWSGGTSRAHLVQPGVGKEWMEGALSHASQKPPAVVPVEDGSHSKEFLSCVEIKLFLWHFGAVAPCLLPDPEIFLLLLLSTPKGLENHHEGMCPM